MSSAPGFSSALSRAPGMLRKGCRRGGYQPASRFLLHPCRRARCGSSPGSLLRREGTREVLPCRGGAAGCRTLRRQGFFSSGADAPLTVRSLWRNGRARWTSNPEVPGSSPGRDDLQVTLRCAAHEVRRCEDSCSPCKKRNSHLEREKNDPNALGKVRRMEELVPFPAGHKHSGVPSELHLSCHCCRVLFPVRQLFLGFWQ